MGTISYIALGSNQGDRRGHLSGALAELCSLKGVTLLSESLVYETDAVGGPADQGKFLNGVAVVNTTLSAEQLLDELNKIEAGRGRPPEDQRVYQGPRPLDLDILLFGDEIIDRPGLTVPHPRMHQRWFVLKPLSDLAPDVVHPVMRRTVSELLASLK